MSGWISSRAGWSAPAVVLVGCATTGTQSGQGRLIYDTHDSMHAEPDRGAARDPQPADSDALPNGPVLDRSAYVRAVLGRSRSIESARQAWRAALARVREAGAFEDPMVTLEIAPLSIGSSAAPLGWSGMVSQRLPWPGKLALDETVSRAEADAQRCDYEAARRELALTASLLFDEHFIVVRSIEINAHHVDLMRSMHAAAIAQFEAGHASAQDPLQAEFELTHMEHDTIILASRRDVTVARMNELLHRDPELPLPPPPDDLPPVAAEAVAAGRLETEAVDRRPDIAGARQHARAEQAQAERNERESYPDVTVSTSYNSMWDTPEHRWMVGLSFNLPVQTGRRQGAVEEANARRAEYEADGARMSDMARTQVVVAVKQLEEAGHVLHIFEERLLPIARQQVDAARAAFISSQVPFGTLIDAEKNLRGVELDQKLAEADCDRRRSELDRALGRIPGLDGGREQDAR
jgi:cobalt-zinc-cadmium efflux system outer membrane protein